MLIKMPWAKNSAKCLDGAVLLQKCWRASYRVLNHDAGRHDRQQRRRKDELTARACVVTPSEKARAESEAGGCHSTQKNLVTGAPAPGREEECGVAGAVC